MQSQQLPTESQVLEDEVLPGTENADQPTEEMSERHDHSGNYFGRVRIELCVKSFILQVYDVLARQSLSSRCKTESNRLRSRKWNCGFSGIETVWVTNSARDAA